MKLSIRLIIFTVLMAIISFLVWLVAVDILLPIVLNKYSSYIGEYTIAMALVGMFIWAVLFSFIGKQLKIDELIDKFLKNDE